MTTKLYINDTPNSKLISADPSNWETSVLNSTGAVIAAMDQYHTYFVMPHNSYNHATYNADKATHSAQQVSVLLPSGACLLVVMGGNQVVEVLSNATIDGMDKNTVDFYHCSNATNGLLSDAETTANTVNNPASSTSPMQVVIPYIESFIIYNNEVDKSIALTKVNDPKFPAYVEPGLGSKFTTGDTIALKPGMQMVKSLTQVVVQTIDPKGHRPLPTVEMSSDVVEDDQKKRQYPPTQDVNGTSLWGKYHS